MNDLEIKLFTEGILLANDEFFIDALKKFDDLIVNFPDSELVDDAYYNKGLCYLRSSQYDKAINEFKTVITDYPDSTISVLQGNDEFGKTPTKCIYAIVNCLLIQNKVNDAEEFFKSYPFDENTYILDNGEKKIYSALTSELILNYKSINNE